jgi:type II secretion system protein C
MQTKTKNSVAWAALGASLFAAAWVAYDIYSRYRALTAEDQVIHFNDSAIASTGNANATLDETIKAHIFGVEPVKSEKAEVPEVVNAPETKLNLKLTGLFAGTDPTNGYAMVEVSRGETSIVVVGNAIGKTGARLHTVESDHILIQHKGRIEKLKLEREDFGLKNLETTPQATVRQYNLSQSELATLTEIGNSGDSTDLQSGVQSFTIGAPTQIEEDDEDPELEDEVSEEGDAGQ